VTATYDGISAAAAFIILALTYSYTYVVGQPDVFGYLSRTSGLLFAINTVVIGVSVLAGIAMRRTVFTAVATFAWMFFVIALREQIIRRWDAILAEQHLFEVGQMLLLIYLLCMLLLNLGRPRPILPARDLQPRTGRIRILLALACALMLQLGVAAVFGDDLISSRYEARETLDETASGRLGSMLLWFIMPLTYFLPFLCIAVLLAVRRLRSVSMFIIISPFFLISLIINNPTIVSRNYLGTLLIGSIFLILGARRAFLCFILLLCSSFIAPMLNTFRSMRSIDEGVRTPGLEAFASWDFDAFANMLYAILYVEKLGTLAWMNLVSATVFFVPREFWAAKLEASGAVVMEAVGATYRISWPPYTAQPIAAEGYLAAGEIGVVALSIGFALVVRFLDSAPVSARLAERLINLRTIWLSFSPVLIYFASRGSLFAAIVQTSSMFAALTVAYYLLGLTSRTISQSNADADASSTAPAFAARWMRTRQAHVSLGKDDPPIRDRSTNVHTRAFWRPPKTALIKA
jgi:hypothetical protein